MSLLEKHSVYQKFCQFFHENSVEFKANHLLSLSGGRDSICLFHLFLEARRENKIGSFRAIHFNHGARLESDKEELFVRKICENNNVELFVVSLNLKMDGNFEQTAREKRYQKIDDLIEDNEVCSLGHHLDDCFEWSLMRFFRSGDEDFIKGIPKVREHFIRPMSSISRREIDELIKEFDIPFIEDGSNSDTRFDRNHLRQTVIPEIRDRYPNYLDFYLSRRESFLSHFNKASSRNELKLIIRGEKSSIFFVDPTCGLKSFHSNFLKEEIIKLSKNKRGSLTRELNKLVSAFNAGKKGPMQFSGDCFIWLDKPFLIIYKSEFLDHLEVLHLEELSSYSNREGFVHALQKLSAVCPFIYQNLNNKKARQKPVKSTVPSSFGKCLSLENIYSLGDVYKSLPDV